MDDVHGPDVEPGRKRADEQEVILFHGPDGDVQVIPVGMPFGPEPHVVVLPLGRSPDLVEALRQSEADFSTWEECRGGSMTRAVGAAAETRNGFVAPASTRVVADAASRALERRDHFLGVHETSPF